MLILHNLAREPRGVSLGDDNMATVFVGDARERAWRPQHANVAYPKGKSPVT